MGDGGTTLLKEMFDEARFREVAEKLGGLGSGFDRVGFLDASLANLEELSLMARMRRMTEALHGAIPFGFRENVNLLRELAPQLEPGFVTMFLPDYVGLYGRDDFDFSMESLRFFTAFGSSEFAVREFIRLDQERALGIMREWSQDEDEHVRRLASEGCRPRLPWSFRLQGLLDNPRPTLPILENLRSDPALYVRKSVANHLNDISKDHPELVMDVLDGWQLADGKTFWIAKQGLRTLIKAGEQRALGMIGATPKPKVRIEDFRLDPPKMQLGESLTLSACIVSESSEMQRLVIDYAIHYVKKSGLGSAKVFKLRELSLGPRERMEIRKSQLIRDFSTRKHHAGFHRVELLVNGEGAVAGGFDLAL